MQLEPGDQIGRFTIVDHCSNGSTSEVYKATAEDGSSVALKLLVADSTEGRGISEAERSALEAVDHPAVVSLVAQGVHDGHDWLATTWVEGRTLAHLIRTEGPLPVARMARIFGVLAAGLDHLAEMGIVHGDLSGGNVVVDVNDAPVIIDLGLARAEVDAAATATPGSIGTPLYTAPEILRGDTVDHRADQYSLALLVFEALTGAWPYPSDGPALTVLHHHLNTAPAGASEHKPALSGIADDALDRALAKNPSDRFETAGGFIEALARPEEANANATARGRTPVTDRSDNASDDSSGGAGADPDKELESKRVRWIVGAIALIALVGLADNLFRGGGDPAAACNLFPVGDFEDDNTGINYYEAAGLPLSIDPTGGETASAGLVIEAPEGWSKYAQIVPVDPGTDYRFEAWVPASDAPRVDLVVAFLDEDFEPIGDEQDDARLSLAGRPDGSYALNALAPPGALAAVPTVFVEGLAAGGTSTIDNVSFGPDGCGS